MASQAQLNAELASLNAQAADLRRQISLYQSQGDNANAAELQATLSQVELQITSVQEELNNITTDNTEPQPGDNVVIAPKEQVTPQNTPDVNPSATAAEVPGSTEVPGIPQVVVTASPINAQSQGAKEANTNFKQTADWRVRLSLGPGAKYLYKSENPGLLAPLKDTNGIIFPYTPAISIDYVANYEAPDLAHTNYKIFQYKNSSVESVNIVADFTAQDNREAGYVLAVIHFLRSVTKMFYGQDQDPIRGTPPPLCYLSGLGAFQFDNCPLVITRFFYSLPNDVDYIRTGSSVTGSGTNLAAYQLKVNTSTVSNRRLGAAGLQPGGGLKAPQFQNLSNTQATYIPTKMQFQITAFPIVVREQISNEFSLSAYAQGKLASATDKRGGIW